MPPGSVLSVLPDSTQAVPPAWADLLIDDVWAHVASLLAPRHKASLRQACVRLRRLVNATVTHLEVRMLYEEPGSALWTTPCGARKRMLTGIVVLAGQIMLQRNPPCIPPFSLPPSDRPPCIPPLLPPPDRPLSARQRPHMAPLLELPLGHAPGGVSPVLPRSQGGAGCLPVSLPEGEGQPASLPHLGPVIEPPLPSAMQLACRSSGSRPLSPLRR